MGALRKTKFAQQAMVEGKDVVHATTTRALRSVLLRLPIELQDQAWFVPDAFFVSQVSVDAASMLKQLKVRR